MAEQRPPSAAEALYPDLKSSVPPVATRGAARTDVASAMWPALTKEARAVQAWRQRDHDSTLRLLRQANANIDARRARDRGR